MKTRRQWLCGSAALLLGRALPAGATLAAPAAAARDTVIPPLDVPYVPTAMSVVDAMLDMAKVTRDDVVYDLGCGDGRIVIRAAERFGCRGVGVDLNPERVREANENARKAGVTQLTRFEIGDVFKFDFSGATVVTMYLLPSVNLKLRPRLLAELKPGTRIVSHDFDMGDWTPITVRDVGRSRVYYWEVPKR